MAIPVAAVVVLAVVAGALVAVSRRGSSVSGDPAADRARAAAIQSALAAPDPSRSPDAGTAPATAPPAGGGDADRALALATLPGRSDLGASWTPDVSAVIARPADLGLCPPDTVDRAALATGAESFDYAPQAGGASPSRVLVASLALMSPSAAADALGSVATDGKQSCEDGAVGRLLDAHRDATPAGIPSLEATAETVAGARTVHVHIAVPYDSQGITHTWVEDGYYLTAGRTLVSATFLPCPCGAAPQGSVDSALAAVVRHATAHTSSA